MRRDYQVMHRISDTEWVETWKTRDFRFVLRIRFDGKKKGVVNSEELPLDATPPDIYRAVRRLI